MEFPSNATPYPKNIQKKMDEEFAQLMNDINSNVEPQNAGRKKKQSSLKITSNKRTKHTVKK
jgi:hypothetical protein